ncbi:MULTISPECIES: protein translocase subunit SecD [Methylocaldum]|jgi:preprotein translocase subunit SecD|uniref:protein translocase subunit SecD n=1 Tax=unclassified Methylocaldum TaxID=2622260 RepID=UPI000A3229E2|nr:protein translocase subunit SecD [Methylocaldum sp. RMAD-M]MBP1152686.1 preprotein translocase subunit SecD [Methylocaldum sp. RMAD-M]MVF24313.1 protein translocase subunit SecD [Methylocaldum sp. BRCS4]
MRNRFPLWKNLLIIAVLVLATIYSLPNFFGEDPSVQLSPLRSAKLDEATRVQVEKLLTDAGMQPKSLELSEKRLLVRFTETETQLKAADLLTGSLGNNYTVALNLAPSTPDWLRAISAQPMYLGLDLRGGVHFLMQVDMDAAVRQAEERYAEDIRSLLRESKIRYLSVDRSNQTIEVKFPDGQTLAQARDVMQRELRGLELGEDGTVMRARLSEPERREIRRLAVAQNITTLRNRINELGVAEPVIQQQGEDRIVVQLPGVQDTARAKEILGATATLEFRLVDTEHSAQGLEEGKTPLGARLYQDRSGRPILLQRKIIVTGDQIVDASSGLDSQSGSPAVFVTLNGIGARKMADVTRENIGKPMAVVYIETKTETREVEGRKVATKKKVEEVINVATIRDRFSKRFQITGLDSTEEARNLALLLRAGALAAPVDIVEERTVGPSLGKENIEQGTRSFIIGFALIAAVMILYYKVFGIIANITLLFNVALILSILSLLQATLTLPGIAGITLTIGMAVDANVLIYERIKEELRNGNSIQSSIYAGFERAFGTIFDSNITTLLAAIMLFSIGSGPVKGFAVTLTIGILTSMFTAVMCTRMLVNFVYGQRRVAKLWI